MILYLLTFLGGIFIDQLNQVKYNKLRIYFVIWIFIFMCFSYTNGSDWRNYELEYDDGYINYGIAGRDLGFVAIMNGFRYFISDFWITLGILKCLYLVSCILVLRKFSEHWISALCLMMPLSLLYMLIDNPLRYMVALTFVNFGMLKMFDSRYILFGLFSFIALTCHSASIFCIFIVPFLKFDLFSKFKTTTLVTIYLVTLVLSSSLDSILQLQQIMSDIQANYFGRDGLFDYYQAEDTEGLFSIGTLLNLLLFCLVLKFRKTLTTINEKVFSCTILYFYIFNIAHVLPMGHRIRMALAFFCCLSYVLVMFSDKKYRFLLTVIFCVILAKNLWTPYQYLPYTNSIPYIFTSHKSYSERSNLNLINYKERTGKNWNR